MDRTDLIRYVMKHAETLQTPHEKREFLYALLIRISDGNLIDLQARIEEKNESELQLI